MLLTFNRLLPRLCSLSLLIVTLILLLNLFLLGRRLGCDRIIPEAIEDHTWSIAVALSDQCYDLKEGYVYYNPVCEALNQGGMTKYEHHLKNIGVEYPKNLRDKKLLNAALHKAAHLSFDKDIKSFHAGQINAIPCTDLGLADYYKAAFRLFGLRISAPYNFYFVLLLLTLTCFFVAFWGIPSLLTLPVIYLMALCCLIPALTADDNSATFFNFRLLPLLAVLPTLQILLMAKETWRGRRIDFVSLLIQSCLLSFLITARTSTKWALAALLIPLVFLLFKNIKNLSLKTWISENREVIALFLFLMLISSLIASYKVLALAGSSHFNLNRRVSISPITFAFSVTSLLCVMAGALFFWSKLKEKKIPLLKYSLLLVSAILLPMSAVLFKEHNTMSRGTYILDSAVKWGTRINLLYLFYLSFGAVLSKLKSSYAPLYHKIMGQKNGAIICLLVFIIYKLYFISQLHPLYSSLDVIPNHLTFHNAYIGLEIVPEFIPFKDNRSGDNLGFSAGLDYFLKKNAKRSVKRDDYVSRLTTTYKMGLHDKTIRNAYLKFIWQHPRIVLKAHWTKLKTTEMFVFKFVKDNAKTLFLAYLLCYLIFSASGFFAPLSSQTLITALVVLTISSALPYLYAYPSYLCGEHTLVSSMALVVLAALGSSFFSQGAIRGILLFSGRMKSAAT